VKELRNWVGEQLGAIAKPDDIRFADNLPKTRSGKIMRRLLKSIARGEEITQDVSTLENPAILEQLRGAEPAPPPKSAAAKAAAAPKRAAAGSAARPRKLARRKPHKTPRKGAKRVAKKAPRASKPKPKAPPPRARRLARTSRVRRGVRNPGRTRRAGRRR
jgi:hypothetical protein